MADEGWAREALEYERYYDKDGSPLTRAEYVEKKYGAGAKTEPSYKRIAESTLSNGKWVSTVWLGLDHRFGYEHDLPPLIFETMVFASGDDSADLDMRRYSTEAQAIAGHDLMVAKWESDE